MVNQIKKDITNDNIFVRLVVPPEPTNEEKARFAENEAILIGSPKIHIPDEAKKIWNKAAPKHFYIYPIDPSKNGFTLESSWTFSKNAFNTLKEAKSDLKEYIDAAKYLPFLFLSACGVSVYPQVESFLEHRYRGLHEWLMYFCLDAEQPHPTSTWEGLFEFIVEQVVELPDVTRLYGNPSFSINPDVEVLSDASLSEDLAKRFHPYYELIIEFCQKKSKYVNWMKRVSIGEFVFCCLIEFTYQELIDLGIFPGKKVIKNEISENLTLASKMFLYPNHGRFTVEEPTYVGFLKAIDVSTVLVGRENIYLTRRRRNNQSSAIYKAGRAFRHQGRQAREPEFNALYVHQGRVVVQKDKARGMLQIVKHPTRIHMVREPLPFQKIQK